MTYRATHLSTGTCLAGPGSTDCLAWLRRMGGILLGIPYKPLDHPDHVASRLRQVLTLAASALTPVALLLCRDLMWEE